MAFFQFFMTFFVHLAQPPHAEGVYRRSQEDLYQQDKGTIVFLITKNDPYSTGHFLYLFSDLPLNDQTTIRYSMLMTVSPSRIRFRVVLPLVKVSSVSFWV